MISNVILLTTCTNRKRFSVPDDLNGSNLINGKQDTVLNQWMAHLSKNTLYYPASRVYCGRSFREAHLAQEEISGRLLIISAGLGLIEYMSNIPSYSLTISSGSSDNIQNKIDGKKFVPSEWWQGINNSNPHPIADLVTRNVDKTFVFALSRSYYELIEQDLLSIPLSFLNRIRLIGLAINKVVDQKLQKFVMPYDDRFDGPDGSNNGTKSDYAQRAMRHFVTEVLQRSSSDDLESHINLVKLNLNDLRIPTRFTRTRKKDEEIIELIIKYYPHKTKNSSNLLRIIRDQEKIACEQSRFQKLFNHIKKGYSNEISQR